MKFKFSNRTVCAVFERNIKRRVTLTGVDVRNPCFATKHCVNYTRSEQVASMASSKDNNSNNEAQESLLYSARHGELSVVKAMLEAKDEGKLTLDINCKGKNKTNLGWTPLHLATYFGHKDVVEALLEAGANVDEVNDTGDTALHKASFIGNEELVILLLKYKADVNIMNGEGRTPCDMSKTRDVQRLLEAAGRAERHERELRLLTAAKDGRIDDIQELLSSPNPPNINCVDAQGNTCLHCAAYRGHTRLAVFYASYTGVFT